MGEKGEREKGREGELMYAKTDDNDKVEATSFNNLLKKVTDSCRDSNHPCCRLAAANNV